MKLRIFAEDKPAEKVFEYQLDLLIRPFFSINSTLSGAIALAGLFSALKENKNRKGNTKWFYQILKKI